MWPFFNQEIGPMSDAPSDAMKPVSMTDEKGSA
jgi:hypothetical protein